MFHMVVQRGFSKVARNIFETQCRGTAYLCEHVQHSLDNLRQTEAEP